MPLAPTSPVHGETSHVQVKDKVCSVVTLLHRGSSCRSDSLYLNLKKCNIFRLLGNCYGLWYQSKYIHVYTPD